VTDIRYSKTLVSYDETSTDGGPRQYALIEATVYEGEETAKLTVEGIEAGAVVGVELLLGEDDLLALIIGATEALQAIRANA
jgi:hypothetical protein